MTDNQKKAIEIAKEIMDCQENPRRKSAVQLWKNKKIERIAIALEEAKRQAMIEETVNCYKHCEEAIKAERERCAKIAENYSWMEAEDGYLGLDDEDELQYRAGQEVKKEIAKAIRSEKGL